MDKDFWNLIKNGNELAFSKLYNEYADLLYGYGMKIVSDEELVTEAIQNLFVYLYEKRENLSYPDSIKAYLYASLKRTLIRAASKKRSILVFSFDQVTQTEYNFDLEVDIETAMIQGEHKEETLLKLQNALNELSPQQREVIYLKYYKSCSNDEIAQILGISNQIVRNVASRALLKLRSLGNLRNLFLVIKV